MTVGALVCVAAGFGVVVADGEDGRQAARASIVARAERRLINVVRLSIGYRVLPKRIPRRHALRQYLIQPPHFAARPNGRAQWRGG